MSTGVAGMRHDSENEDYKASRYFVFDDRLRFSDGVKHQLETTLDYPFDQRTTFGASVTPSTLTAEKKTKPDGIPYVLIRKATPAEKRDLFGNDDDDDDDDDYLEEELVSSRAIAASAVPNKLMADLSDEELQSLMRETMLRAADIQEAAEVAFRKRSPSLEETTKSWWSVFGARFRATGGLTPKRPLEKTKLNLAAERAQENAESAFRGHCFLVLGVKHGMKVEDIPQWAMRCWWDVFGMRGKSLLGVHVQAVSAITNVLMQSVLVPGPKIEEGKLIEAVALPWFDIIELLRRDPKTAFQIPPEKWEEIVAGSYHRAGFDEVILTPRSGDFGRDVIAIKRGLGTIRVIDQVKAYGPNHLVTAEEVRALLGVLQADGASKGFLTTTSGFAPRLRRDILLTPWIGPRLELIDGKQLINRLSELASSGPTPLF
jgi:restriction system protein